MSKSTTGVSPPDGSFSTSSNKDVMKNESLVQQKVPVRTDIVLRTWSCRLNGHVNENRNTDDGCFVRDCPSRKWDLMYGDEVTSYELIEDMDNPHVDVDVSKSDGDDKEWVAKVMQEADDNQTHEPYGSDYETPEMKFIKGESAIINVEYQQVTPATIQLRKSRKKVLVQGEDVTVEKVVAYQTPAIKEFEVGVDDDVETCTVTDTKIVGTTYQSSDEEAFDEKEAKSWLPQNLWAYQMKGLESVTVKEASGDVTGKYWNCCMPLIPRVIKMVDIKAYYTLKRNLRLVKEFTPLSFLHTVVLASDALLQDSVEKVTVKTECVFPVKEVSIAVSNSGYKLVEINCWNKAVRDTISLIENKVAPSTVIGTVQWSTEIESSVLDYYGKNSQKDKPLVSPKSMYQFYQNWKKQSMDEKVAIMESIIPDNIGLPMLSVGDDFISLWNDRITPYCKHESEDIHENTNVFIGMKNQSRVPRQNLLIKLGKGDDTRYINRMSSKNGKTSSGQAYKYEPHNLVTILELQSLTYGTNVSFNDETMQDAIVYTKRFFKLPYTPMVFKKNRVAIVGTSKIRNGTDKALVESYIREVLKEYNPLETVVLSGGAVGVDRVAEAVAIELGIETEIYMPEQPSQLWYLARNRAIANMATRVISIVNPLKEVKCYHCDKWGKNDNHEVTGGCYTGKHFSMSTPHEYEVIVIGSGDEQSSTSDSTSSPYNEESAITPDNVDFKNIPENTTVVIGTNDMNWHGRGVAKLAREAGVMDTVKIYKFITKYHPADTTPPYLKPVSLDEFQHNAELFIKFAKAHPERTFIMTAVGCGLAGFKPEQVKGFFKDVPSNVQLPTLFL